MAVERSSDFAGKEPADFSPTDPADVSPTRVIELLGETRQLADALGIDPLDLLVSEIRQQSAILLRLHQDICDGVELATEQVQDKRIEFLERGPEVKVEDIFLTIALTFLLESPLAGVIVGAAFRFADDVARAAFLASRRLKIAQLQKRTRALRPQLRALDSARAALSRNVAEQARASRGRLHMLGVEEVDLRREIARMENQVASAVNAGDRLTAAQRKTELDDKSLRAFLDSIREGSVETGVAAAKAAVAGNEKKGADAPPARSDAEDSIGVQIQALAQSHLRDMEEFFSQIEADADLLRGIARGRPYLHSVCVDVLGEIYLAQQGTAPKGTLPADVKRTVALEIEKLVWAVLNGPDLGIAPGTTFILGAKPPPRVIAYWRQRFFAAETTDDEKTDTEILDAMREVRDRFFDKSEGSPPIHVFAIAFKS